MAQGGPKVASALAIARGMPPTLSPIKLIIRIMLGPGVTCDTAKKFANSWSVIQPLATAKLWTSGRTVGNPPKLTEDSTASTRDAEELFMLWRVRDPRQRC